MSVKTDISTDKSADIVDDLEESTLRAEVATKDATLADLKAKLAAKNKEKDVEKHGEEMTIRMVEKKVKSIKFGVVGSGQAGSRLAETFYNAGYAAVVFNTASQDLEHIKIPDDNKCLLQYGLGGAAKDLEIGRAAAETHKDEINALIETKLEDCQVLLFCLSFLIRV